MTSASRHQLTPDLGRKPTQKEQLLSQTKKGRKLQRNIFKDTKHHKTCLPGVPRSCSGQDSRLSLLRAWVPSLIREQKSHNPCRNATKKPPPKRHPFQEATRRGKQAKRRASTGKGGNLWHKEAGAPMLARGGGPLG